MTDLHNPRTADNPNIVALAHETDTPVEVVFDIYEKEREKLERTARIKTYIPVLAHQHVKAVLKRQGRSLRH